MRTLEGLSEGHYLIRLVHGTGAEPLYINMPDTATLVSYEYAEPETIPAEVSDQLNAALAEADDAIQNTLAALDRLNRQSERNLMELRSARKILEASNSLSLASRAEKGTAE